MTGSWLCRDDTDRDRLVEMEGHLKPARAVTMGMILIPMLASVGFVEDGVLLPTLVGVVVAFSLFWFADMRIDKSERPEHVMFAAWAGSELVIAMCIVVTGGPDSFGLPWLAIPVVTLSARFSMRGVLVGVALALALLAGATFGVDPSGAAANPDIIVATAVLILCVATLSVPLMRSDLQYRGEAAVDPLTGMLNRKALANRADELAQQSDVTGQPVGLIVGDLDNFKRVNDSLGHTAGDAVLRDIAYRLRKRLRAFDLAYRIGGEEFLVLLPGATIEESRAYAEGLRRAVESENVGADIEMTISFGVSASVHGRRFNYQAVFAAADAALYEAKRSGRNRVCTTVKPAEAAESFSPEPATAGIPG